MKTYIKLPAFFILLALIVGCEEDFYPPLQPSEPLYVVDAWINNLPEKQTIRITETLPYFDNNFTPGVSGAVVVLNDDEGNQFTFNEIGDDGNYEWEPNVLQPVLGKIGNTYELQIIIGAMEITSVSALSRVPEVDSVVFRFESSGFIPDSYFASFYGRDPEGPGDTYWIKAFKNGQFLSKPNEINIAFDAGIGVGSNSDGITFIQPVRDGINPFESDENDNFISPYSPGDSVLVEIHSISLEAYTFLSEVQIQTDRPGGFAELFSVPLSNVPTNLASSDNSSVAGFFCMSAISSKKSFLDPANLPN